MFASVIVAYVIEINSNDKFAIFLLGIRTISVGTQTVKN
jgi:hypothetical protein